MKTVLIIQLIATVLTIAKASPVCFGEDKLCDELEPSAVEAHTASSCLDERKDSTLSTTTLGKRMNSFVYDRQKAAFYASNRKNLARTLATYEQRLETLLHGGGDFSVEEYLSFVGRLGDFNKMILRGVKSVVLFKQTRSRFHRVTSLINQSRAEYMRVTKGNPMSLDFPDVMEVDFGDEHHNLKDAKIMVKNLAALENEVQEHLTQLTNGQDVNKKSYEEYQSRFYTLFEEILQESWTKREFLNLQKHIITTISLIETTKSHLSSTSEGEMSTMRSQDII